MVLSWARQVAALAKKELLLLLRAPKKSVTELIAPVLVVVLLGILNVSVSYPSPEVGTQAIDRLASDATVNSHWDGGNFQCRVFDDRVGKFGYGLQIPGAWCIPLIFAPATGEMMEVMRLVAAKNGFNAPKVMQNINYDEFEDAPEEERSIWDRDRGRMPDECVSQYYWDQDRWWRGGEDDEQVDFRCMLGFPDVLTMKKWIKARPGRVGVAVAWGDDTPTPSNTTGTYDGEAYVRELLNSTNGKLPEEEIRYSLWYNFSALQQKWCARARAILFSRAQLAAQFSAPPTR